MTVDKTVLDNGVTVVSEQVPWMNSVAVGLWAPVGSRDESPADNGISHFIEHMLFKGTERRPWAHACVYDPPGGIFKKRGP